MTVLRVLKNKIFGKDEINAALCYFLSNIFTKAFGFLSIPLYTTILSTSEYGYLSTYNAWVSLLCVVMGLSLNSALLAKARFHFEEENRFQSSIISLSLLVAFAITSLTLVAFMAIYGRVDAMVFFALIQGYGTFIITFVLQKWVLDNRYILHSILSVLSAALPIGITCMIVDEFFLGRKYLSVIIPKAAVVIGLMVFFLASILVQGKYYYDRSIWIWGVKYCTPIVFHSLSLTIMLQADRIMISNLYGYDEAGIYSFIYNVTLVVGVLIAALENTWKTWFFKHYGLSMKQLIQERSKLFILVAILGVSVYMFLAPDIVQMLAPKQYQKQLLLVGLIAYAYIISFMYDFLVYVEYKMEATKNIAKASIIAATVNLVLNYFIIPIYGGIGAACTTCISYALQFCIHLLVVRKLDWGLYPLKMFSPFLLGGAGVIVVFFLTLNIPIARYFMVITFMSLMFRIIYKKRNILV